MESFEALWQRLAGPIRAAVARVRSPDAALDADDLLQEVRIRLWEVYRGDNNSGFRPSYYLRVVNSAIIDSLRRHRARAPGCDDDAALDSLPDDAPGPEGRLAAEMQAGRLKAAIDDLPPAYGQAVALYLQGYTVAEIAGLLKCNPDRAHNLTYRAIRELKKRMSECDE